MRINQLAWTLLGRASLLLPETRISIIPEVKPKHILVGASGLLRLDSEVWCLVFRTSSLGAESEYGSCYLEMQFYDMFLAV